MMKMPRRRTKSLATKKAHKNIVCRETLWNQLEQEKERTGYGVSYLMELGAMMMLDYLSWEKPEQAIDTIESGEFRLDVRKLNAWEIEQKGKIREYAAKWNAQKNGK